jgi:3-hydroxyisobutyrate dehydrogenase-like beta-hydroxyacid dehydrogenase
MAVTRIGIIGAGAIGLPMALRLQNHGYAVTVCDADPRRCDQATRHRLRLAPTPAETALYSRCTIVAVATGEQVEAVLFGRGGAADVLRAGDCILLCTNQSAEAVERQAARLAERGVACIDAPVSGGPDRAGYGTLTMLLACEASLAERHRPMIDALASRVMMVGSRVGMASIAAAINNLAAAINLAGAAEAMAIAQRAGLDTVPMLEIIENASGQSWIGSERLSRLIRGDGDTHLRIDHVARESRATASTARALGLDTPLAAAVAAQFERACAAGLAQSDDRSLFAFVRDPEGSAEAPLPASPDAQRTDTGTDNGADTGSEQPAGGCLGG